MTVNDLIKILQTLPPDLTVVNEGYETGFEPIKKVTIIQVDENRSHEWWDGKYATLWLKKVFSCLYITLNS